MCGRRRFWGGRWLPAVCDARWVRTTIAKKHFSGEPAGILRRVLRVGRQRSAWPTPGKVRAVLRNFSGASRNNPSLLGARAMFHSLSCRSHRVIQAVHRTVESELLAFRIASI